MKVVYLTIGLIVTFVVPLGLLKLGILYSDYKNKKDGKQS